MTTTITRYFPQIRRQDEFQDSMEDQRDWLHDSYPMTFDLTTMFATFVEAEAALAEALETEAFDASDPDDDSFVLEELKNWKKELVYAPKEGGGFWFDHPVIGEGRALVREFRVILP